MSNKSGKSTGTKKITDSEKKIITASSIFIAAVILITVIVIVIVSVKNKPETTDSPTEAQSEAQSDVIKDYMTTDNYTADILEDGTVSVGSYTGEGNIITVPDKIKGRAVTQIDSFCFNGNTDVKEIVLPESITKICESAFSMCSSLEKINLPDSLKIIEASAFFCCESLTGTLNLPQGVTEIGDYAFAGCLGVTNINIPSSANKLGAGIFSSCTSLKRVSINSSPDTINSYTFQSCSLLESLTVPSSVKSLGDEVFFGCDSLKKLTLPEGISSIGNNVFGTIPWLETLDTDYLIFGDGILASYLGEETEITLPDSIKSIAGNSAFMNCPSLKSVTVSSDNKFFSSVDGVLYSKDGKILEAYPPAKENTGFKIPEGVTEIGKNAFYGCGGIEQIAVPDSVTKIGYKAFAYSSLSLLESSYKIKVIEDYAFMQCDKLRSFVIPKSAESLGEGLFFGCDSFAEVFFEPGISQISGNLFVECPSFVAAHIPESVANIDENTFKDCSENFSFFGKSDSYIEKFAKEKEIQFYED